MNIQNLISMSVIFLYIIPVLLYVYTLNSIHLIALIGTIGTTLISETLKYYFIKDSNPRPQGAKDCNLLCNDGNQSGKPGMPSSHSAQVAFFSGYYYQQTDNKFIRATLIIYSGLVMISRYLKKCHTLSQILVGAILGLVLSLIVVRQL